MRVNAIDEVFLSIDRVLEQIPQYEPNVDL